MVFKKIANESVVCRQTALVRANLGGRQNKQTAQDQDKQTRLTHQTGTGGVDLEKGSSENYLGGEPFYHTSAIFIQDS